MNDLRLLTIGDSEFLLLEMPFSKWTEYMLREVEELAATTNLKIVIAHIDRYIKLQKNGTFERLLNSGIYIQANAEYFNGLFTKNRAIKELSCGMIHFIGSDSHNMTTRAPNIGKTYEFIEKKLGVGFINRMDEYGKNVLMQI